jgi:hypothetical protein
MQSMALAAAARGGLGPASSALPPLASATAGAAAAGAGAGGMARVMATCAAVFKADGLPGFYAGIKPNMLQVREGP